MRELRKKNKMHPLFSALDEAALDEALTLLRGVEQSYKKGECLRRAGDSFFSFGLVLSGRVEVYMEDFDGGRMMMASVGEGDSFGESLAYLHTEESPVFVFAAEDARVVWLDASFFKQTVSCHTASLPLLLRERFVSLLATRALMQNDRIQILSKAGLRARLVTFFSQCEHRYKSKTFRVPFDRASLAVYLGVNRTALSRELSRMREEGILDFYKDSFRLL
ncbi:MAG: Crp/Fnr family transcriptional regulator [Clostridia bacterium]|nr:Crp/Fnr family transcriptional regulator [Clostridia bacterium]